MTRFNYKGLDIIAMSDTHGWHRHFDIPSCDIIIHAGDACECGDEVQLKDFFDWFSKLPAKHLIFVHGNHDLPFELYPESCSDYMPSNVCYLKDSRINIEGINILGLNATMGLLTKVDIGNQTIDIIVSHCAPKGKGDGGQGDLPLLDYINKIKPNISIFGHFHKFSGYDETIDGIRFMNVTTIEPYDIWNRRADDYIKELRENEIFVFGSNIGGYHGGGAARTAMQWGAVWGQGVGLQGRTYAIPTMDGSVDKIKPYVDEFIEFAKSKPDKTFLVTEIGCGIAGYSPAEIAPLFCSSLEVSNIHLPASFWKIIVGFKNKNYNYFYGSEKIIKG